ncbi:hypothetical protein M2156_005775 [Streptomyces sp. SAI-149]|nr:hypothetical protein [Streptomyces sp. SAI-149]
MSTFLVQFSFGWLSFSLTAALPCSYGLAHSSARLFSRFRVLLDPSAAPGGVLAPLIPEAPVLPAFLVLGLLLLPPAPCARVGATATAGGSGTPPVLRAAPKRLPAFRGGVVWRSGRGLPCGVSRGGRGERKDRGRTRKGRSSIVGTQWVPPVKLTGFHGWNPAVLPGRVPPVEPCLLTWVPRVEPSFDLRRFDLLSASGLAFFDVLIGHRRLCGRRTRDSRAGLIGVLRSSLAGLQALLELRRGRCGRYPEGEDPVDRRTSRLAGLHALDKPFGYQLRDDGDGALVGHADPCRETGEAGACEARLIIGTVRDLHEGEFLALAEHVRRQVGRSNHQLDGHGSPWAVQARRQDGVPRPVAPGRG